MKENSLCPRFEKAMQLLGKRWTGLVLYQLLTKPSQRFSEIESTLPISGRLLSERLKDLEKEGLVKRNIYPEVPPRVEYSLTEKGRALESTINDIQKWASEWIQN
jgi:DNA-binding HxlR family transcriptional regulator